jgi:pimeloyl-ACP methyl ester carboxylesterase
VLGSRRILGVHVVSCPELDVTVASAWTEAGSTYSPDELELAIIAALGVDTKPPSVQPTATTASAEAMLARPIALTRGVECPEAAPDGASCGTAAVPLDWSDAASPTIDVWFAAVTSTAGSSTDTLIPFVGGPGGALTEELESFAPLFAALPNHDQLLVDVRGVGLSGRLACDRLDEAGSLVGDRQPIANAECAEQLGERRDHYNTVSSVLDIEAIRRAMAMPKPSLLGFSYGTWMASTYSILFPDIVTRTVLDGAFPLPNEQWSSDVANTFDSVISLLCSRKTTCSAREVSAQASAVAIALRTTPQPIPGTDEQLTEGGFATILQTYLPSSPDRLFAALAQASSGDYAVLTELAQEALFSVAAAPIGGSTALGVAVSCNDYVTPFDLNDDVATRRQNFAARLDALPGEAFGWISPQGWIDSLWETDQCLNWPTPQAVDELRVPYNGPFPELPVLVINGDLDLNTPSNGGELAASRFPNSVFLDIANAGHVVLPVSPCSLTTALEFLSTATLPPTDICADEILDSP